MSCNIHYVNLLKLRTCSYQIEKKFEPHCKTYVFKEKNTVFLQCRFIKHFVEDLNLFVFLLSERVNVLTLLTKREPETLGHSLPLFAGIGWRLPPPWLLLIYGKRIFSFYNLKENKGLFCLLVGLCNHWS